MSDEKPGPGWTWQRIPAGVYGLSDKRGRRLMHVTPAATIEFASPGIAALIADAPAMLDLLRRLESEVACTCSDTADAAECACDEGSAAVNCGCVCHPLGALLDKHGRSS